MYLFKLIYSNLSIIKEFWGEYETFLEILEDFYRELIAIISMVIFNDTD